MKGCVISPENERQQQQTLSFDVLEFFSIGAANCQRIRLEKVLFGWIRVDFTLIGRPLFPRDLVNIEATIVE